MNILAIDPGNIKSAYVCMDENSIFEKGIEYNEAILQIIAHSPENPLVIEMIASYGMAVGKTVFDTCLWIGKFIREAELAKIPVELVYRKDIKLHLCQTMRAKDSNIIQALKDRYGEVGRKANPGPLYGVSKDIWSALAVGTYYLDTGGKDA